MEATLPLVAINVKLEPMDSETVVKIEQNDNNQETEEVREDELWIKAEPYDEDSQDAANGTVSENEAKIDEEVLNDELNRNRQSHAPSKKQILVFLDFLNEHRDLANCKLRSTPDGRVRANQLWQTITETLNNIGPCAKTMQQWQRVWYDKKYLARKTAAARFEFLTAGKNIALASELTLQDEKILAILGERIPPRNSRAKSATLEPKPLTPKQPQDISIAVPTNREITKLQLNPQLITSTEQLPSHPEAPQLPRRPYTPRKTVSPNIELSGKTSVPSAPVIPPTNVLSQSDAPKPPDDPPNSDGQLDELPSSAFISDLPSSSRVQQESIPRAQTRPRASLGSYRKKFIHLEKQRLKNDAKRNAELTRIHHSLERGNTELAGIKNVIQEMVGLMKQLIEKRRDNE